MKDGASQEIKTNCSDSQAFLLGSFCEGMRRFIKLKKTALLSIAKPPNTGIAADAGDAVMGGFSRQQPGNPPRCPETGVGKSRRGSQQTVTHTQKSDLLSQSGNPAGSPSFTCVWEHPKSTALPPLSGCRLLTPSAGPTPSSSLPPFLPP